MRLFPADDDRPLLDRLVRQYEHYPSFRDPKFKDGSKPVPSLRFVRHLVDTGSDPNEAYDGQTVWGNALRECVCVSKLKSQWTAEQVQTELLPRLAHWADIIELFIAAGADPIPNRNSPQASCVREAFGELLEHRAKQFDKSLSRRRKQWFLERRFITPPLKRILPTREELTPITVLNRQVRAIPAQPFTERFSSPESIGTSERSKRPGTRLETDKDKYEGAGSYISSNPLVQPDHRKGHNTE